MSVKRAVWETLFQKNAFPGLPCPQCENGKLKLMPGSFHMVEPQFSIAAHRHDDWEPDWITNRFSARMQCDEANCGEVVAIAGDTEMAPVYLDDDEVSPGWAEQEVLRARSIYPAPPLFPVPVKTPNKVKRQLSLSFQLFWSDLPSAVGRLRTAVELMLDGQNIPSEKLTKKGKAMRMDLAERIEAFAATATGDDAKEALHGLRYIGNLGTHGSGVTKEAFFDAADVLEDVLLGVYERKSIKAKVKSLTDNRGAY